MKSEKQEKRKLIITFEHEKLIKTDTRKRVYQKEKL